MFMIQSKEDYLFYLKEDAKVNIHTDHCDSLRMWANIWYGNENYCFLRYLRALRKYEYVLNCTNGFWGKIRTLYAKIVWHRIGAKYGIIIKPNIVGYVLRMPHLVGGAILHCKSVGNYCTINSGVIVGTNNKGGLAVIGDHVDLSVGCKIIGDVTIGDNVIVAPNSVVVKNIPENCIVSGVPAVIIKQNGKKV